MVNTLLEDSVVSLEYGIVVFSFMTVVCRTVLSSVTTEGVFLKLDWVVVKSVVISEVTGVE